MKNIPVPLYGILCVLAGFEATMAIVVFELPAWSGTLMGICMVAIVVLSSTWVQKP